ncbi:TraX family protein [Peptostreptococcus porci]|uniref:TraX family protein n=1 Tax=Peptostreptococcus porci TaxID=2652282 RepID=UPI0023F44766|nr:TraX family protein [Peptostreptococcus porci]MDD7182831.1 TraX family protein [Peptostreptococcus porci]
MRIYRGNLNNGGYILIKPLIYYVKIKIFSGAQLKIVAMATMLIDHVNKAIIYPNLISNTGILAYLSDFFDIIGRIAFTILVVYLYAVNVEKAYIM